MNTMNTVLTVCAKHLVEVCLTQYLRHTCTKKLFVVYVKSNWESCVLRPHLYETEDKNIWNDCLLKIGRGMGLGKMQIKWNKTDKKNKNKRGHA